MNDEPCCLCGSKSKSVPLPARSCACLSKCLFKCLTVGEQSERLFGNLLVVSARPMQSAAGKPKGCIAFAGQRIEEHLRSPLRLRICARTMRIWMGARSRRRIAAAAASLCDSSALLQFRSYVLVRATASAL